MSADPQRTRARIEQAANKAAPTNLRERFQPELRAIVDAAAREALQMVKEDIQQLRTHPLPTDREIGLDDASAIIEKSLADLASDEDGKDR